MKKLVTLFICLILAATFSFVGCDSLVATNTNGGNAGGTASGESASGESASGGTTDGGSSSGSSSSVEDSTYSSETEISDQTGDFTITSANGSEVEQSGAVYTITTADSYTLTGSLEGQIVVDAGDDDEIEIILSGATIKYGENSPILIKNASEATVKAAKGTENTVYDTRSQKTTDVDDQGEGAISAKCDLKLAATGSLYVEGNYNNGVHTTKDLTIQKMTLKVKAVNNALKGKHSVTIKSGSIDLITTGGDGIKTEDTDLSSKGKQRGSITIGETDSDETPTVNVYSADEGIDAAYNFEMLAGTLNVYAGSYSSYTPSSFDTSSSKGIRAQNELLVKGGAIDVKATDDGLHADYGTALDNGSVSLGNITISGGTVTMKVNTSATSSGTSPSRPFSTNSSGADAIHADNTLTISGGTVDVASAYEGLEATHIVISGGTTTVYATDDGLNAAKKIDNSPSILISGGTVDITMGSGDTDGIDSNGTFTQTGGLVISRGAVGGNNMATGLDCDGTAKITGGTFIQLGARETIPTLTGCYSLILGSSSSGSFGPGMRGRFAVSNAAAASSYSFTSGTYTISGTDLSFSVASGYTYTGLFVYSSALTKGTSYTVSNGSVSYSATAN